MARQRKTRQQKIIAGLRRKVSTIEAKSPPSHIHISEIIPSVSSTSIRTEPSNYAYVIKDLRKTGILTFAIIGAQLLLFFLLRNRMISLPGLA
jgi:hypothetical protein